MGIKVGRPILEGPSCFEKPQDERPRLPRSTRGIIAGHTRRLVCVSRMVYALNMVNKK